MINHYSEKLIKTIDAKIESGLIVFKGFPSDFLKTISNAIPFLSKRDQFDKKGRVDLNEILKNNKSILGDYLSLSELNITTFEEFTYVIRNVNPDMLDYKVMIITNDLFRGWYPNPSNYDFPDQLEQIEKDNNYEPDNIFSNFYSSSKIINKNSFVSYFDLISEDFKEIEEINFFEDIIHPNDLKLLSTENSENKIELPSPDDIFTAIKTNFYNGKVDGKYGFIISGEAQHLEKNIIIKELSILNDLSLHFNTVFSVYTKKETIEETIRDQFYVLLKQYWKSEKFRPLIFYKEPESSNEKIEVSQGQVIEYIVEQSQAAMLDQKYRDVFLTAPTGSGKSLLFQIPALYLSQKNNAVTIVVSPLKALMYDQVSALKEKGITDACFINSDISFIKRQENIDALHSGEKSILYLSPELLLSYSISEFIGERTLGLLVIDEAHLVSTWGRDFRVDYWYLGKYLRNVRKYTQQNFPVIALTATAVYGGENDVVFETIESLNMRIPKLYIGNVRRNEIKFSINEFSYEGNHEEEKIKNTVKRIEQNILDEIKTICYFPWTRQIEVALIKILINEENQNKVGKYYGNVDQFERLDVINRFKDNSIRAVLATKAFGMGVDIDNIKEVYHHAPSGNLSDYVQEIGRVARKKSMIGRAAVDFSKNDLKFTKILYGLSSVKLFQVKLVLQKIFNVYLLKKKQNLLFSVEDFQYIFPDLASVESKVKSTLLLIENDFLEKYGYYVILVRPKSLYSKVFAEIPKAIEKSFLSKYSEFSRKIKKPILNEDNEIKTFDGLKITQRGSENNFYIIELDKLWEKHFSEDSFPKVKRKFFNRELFSAENESNPIPLNKLAVTLNQSIAESYHSLEYYWAILCDAFQDLSGHFFTNKDLEDILKPSIKERILRKRICDLALTTYSSRIRLQNNKLQTENPESFLQMRSENNRPKYRIRNNRFFTVSKKIKRQFTQMFCLNEPYFEKYLDPRSLLTSGYIKLVHQIESFQIGSYEFSGGMTPRIFIRINDPFKVRVVSNDERYENLILKSISKRQVLSMDIMEYFFTNDISDDSRWHLIEDYFLGRGVEDLKSNNV